MNFPFNILDVINCLGLQIRRVCNNEVYIDCPHCIVNPKNGHSGKGKCQVIISSGIYNCCRCGHGGGMIDLYCAIKGVDKSTANREMREYVNDDTYKFNKEQISKIVSAANNDVLNNVKLASRKEIDRTYRAFLSLCKLRQEHKSNLLARGLSEKNIEHYGFKSTPNTPVQHREIINALIAEGYTLKGVPGFYVNKKGDWDFAINDRLQGFFIPMCNLQNECLGLQIRLDNPFPNAKYIWLSSKKYSHGCGRTSVPHITNTQYIGESVYITEGGLKADIAHIVSKRTFVAIAGVTQLKVLPLLFSQLKRQGVKRIIDSYDSDCKYNQQVEDARQRLKEAVVKAGLEYYRLDWDDKYKGIDDYLVGCPKGSRKFIVYDK